MAVASMLKSIEIVDENTKAVGETDEIYSLVTEQTDEMKKLYDRVENLKSYSKTLKEKVGEFKL